MKMLFVGFAFLAGCAFGAVEPGENLVMNGNLEVAGKEYPYFWQVSSTRNVGYQRAAGPESSGALVFKSADAAEVSVNARQGGLKLVAGERYKISAWIKTRDFESRNCGVIVHNAGWHSSQGIRKLPENSTGWQLFESAFDLTTSQNGTYGIALFAQRFKGEAHFACIKLEALSSKALAGSELSPLRLQQRQPRLVPTSPLLNHIPVSAPRLTFQFFDALGRTRGKDHLSSEYDCVYRLDGRSFQKHVLQPERNQVDLSGVALGDHHLESAIVERRSGKRVFAATNTITLIQPATIDTSGHRRLNNFTTEVLSQELTPYAGAQVFNFYNPREGWVFIGLGGAGSNTNTRVDLAGVGAVIGPDTPRAETFRHLPAGFHALAVRNAEVRSRLTVRSIVEIFNYPACGSSQVPQNGKYDWDFHEKHVFPAVTTLNGGGIPQQHLARFKQYGLRWLGNLLTRDLRSAEEFVERLQGAAGLNDPQYDGITCDEQGFWQSTLPYYSAGLRGYANPRERLIYTWVTDRPYIPSINHDFISASLNASRGRGRLLYEAYCISRPTEEEAREHIDTHILQVMQGITSYYSEVAPNTGIIFGNFNQIPIISLDVIPEVDYKYYLDMQVNLVANHPAFQGLAATGYWGSYYGDEELYRWSFKLMRHYCVEGRTNMLSESYGYRYAPGHLRNCDFIHGLEGWRAEPAFEGALAADSFRRYGTHGGGSQGRWHAGETGNTFCLFKRREGSASRLSQMAVNLAPGKTYTLQFVTADYGDMLEKRFNPRQHGVEASLGDGAELLPEKCFVYVDRRNSGRKKDDGQARVNLHHLRFRALKSTTMLSFSDRAAAAGEQLALNYVMLKPYYGMSSDADAADGRASGSFRH